MLSAHSCCGVWRWLKTQTTVRQTVLHVQQRNARCQVGWALVITALRAWNPADCSAVSVISPSLSGALVRSLSLSLSRRVLKLIYVIVYVKQIAYDYL